MMARGIASLLPANWSGFNEQQKISWFNQNAVTPEELASAGVPQDVITTMQGRGYTGAAANANNATANNATANTATVDPKAVRTGLTTAQQKADEYKRLRGLGMSDADIRSAVTPVYGAQSDADWASLQGLATDLKAVKTGLTTAQQKADEYKRLRGLGMSDADIRSAVTPVYGTQSDADWKSLQGLAGFGSTGSNSNVNANTTTIDASQSTLSPNFAPYVYKMLAKGEAAADLPFQPFEGERFAPTSDLQKQAFAGLAGLKDYTPTTFDTGLGALKSVQDYMSPYQQAVTDIEAREARRQADIGRTSEQARLAQAGAYGGSRQAIMEAERQRNLGTQIGDITSKGLQGAYDRAMQQRLAESKLGLEAQGMGEYSKQFGAKYGLESIDKQLAAGETQRQIAQQPLDFGYQQFQESVKFPYQQATFMQSLLGGLPLQANQYQANPGQSGMFSALQGGLAGLGLYNALNPK
jgi:hypothetical protein